ncbi:MAG: recombinase family protein [Chthoniobacteraceae bacterium]
MRTPRTRKPATPETTQKVVRCAIYTRKSTEEGLAMEFNSLDAQREAAEAFISSQRHEGWVVLPEKYDDGGFTGGNMERPALKRLMADIEAKNIDTVVVYKVDRLSRSLLDFSRLMEVLDRNGCSFVSVTQQFNTTHSMGRLTLNILLSFAQFEREIISERTRDKMSAARRKGKWVGGSLILGYDLNAERTRLVVNPPEAERVRAIFALYIETQSLLATAAELNRRGWPRKTWMNKNGTTAGGGIWNKPNLLGLLSNVGYIGKVAYDGEIYNGEHDAILDLAIWAAAQAVLTRNQREGGASVRNKYGALLRGFLVCGTCGCAMTHSYTAKGRTRYRYYVCQKAMKQGWQECETRSVPAQEIENFVIQRIKAIGRDPELAAEIASQAREEHHRLGTALRAEQADLQQNLCEQARGITGLLEQPNAVGRLAELEDQVRAGENRLAQIAVELSALGPQEIDEADVTAALGRFEEIAGMLTPAEKERLVHLLVERVVYDGKKSTVAITFRPTGIKTMSEETL